MDFSSMLWVYRQSPEAEKPGRGVAGEAAKETRGRDGKQKQRQQENANFFQGMFHFLYLMRSRKPPLYET
jgi:hypothetical protein